jgi:gliding motility-associated-like protein
MKNKHYSLLIGLFLMILPQFSWGTHIVGGEINYRCLGNDLYEIEFTIFRDCYTGIPDFDYPASVGIFSFNTVADSFELVTSISDTLLLTDDVLMRMAANSGWNVSQIGSKIILPNPIGPDTLISYGHLLIPFINNDTLNPQLSNPCLVIPPNVCVNTTTYLDTVRLPVIPEGYTLSYQRCCRNESIINIVAPNTVGTTYIATLNETALMECNNSAKFNDWPPIYICVNEPIDYDHSATDIDGDSLVYKLCIPFIGGTNSNAIGVGPRPTPAEAPPYDEVVWTDPPYNLNNVMGGVPLAIDSGTGFLTGIPNTIGQFVVGICVEEYRNGELISESRRDFQYNVGICGSLTAAFFVPEINCEGLEVTFENQSQFSSASIWYFNDPAYPDSSSNLENPTFTFSDTGSYTVMLIAEPTSTTCTDTAFATFSVYYPSLFSGFDYEVTNCIDPIEVNLMDMSFDTITNITNWEWQVNGSAFSNDQIPPNYIADPTQGTLTIDLIVTNNLGCMDTISQEVIVGLLLDYEIFHPTCEISDSTTLEVNLLNQPGVFDISWAPQSAILNGQNTTTPTVNLQNDSVFYFTIEYDNDCIFEDSIVVINENKDIMLSATATPDSIFEGNTSQLEATGLDIISYEWTPTETLNDPNIFNPLASPEVTTTYTVIGTDSQGCMDTTFVLVALIDILCEEPYLFMPNAFTPNGDSENDVLFVEGNVIDEMYLAIYNRWGEKVFESEDKSIGWNGMYKNELLEPDVYGFYLRVKCVNGEEYFKKGNISLIR